MARIPALAATAKGGRRLVDLWAAAPSVANWQEPLGQDAIVTSVSSYESDTNKLLLIGAIFVIVFIIGFCCIICYFSWKKEDNESDTSSVDGGPWSNDDIGEGVNAPPLLPLEEQQPPESRDGHGPQSNSGEEGDRPHRRRRRRQQQPPTVVEVPTTADIMLSLGGIELTQAGMEWVLANLELPAPAVDVDIAPAADEEMAPAPEPAPTLKCTYSKADGWAEGTCSVCLSELVDGEKVRVLTACMHCFHATCVETWLRRNATCPLCRAPAIAVPARGRRRRCRHPAEPNLNLA